MSLPQDRFVPEFDPWDGGVNACCLFLLEAPGKWAKASGFASRNNDSETSKNLFGLCREAGINRRQTIMWNVVPWYIGDETKIRQATSTDIQEGVPHLLRLLDLLPQLRLVMLFGGKAQRVGAALQSAKPDLRLISCLHPSPVSLNQRLEKRGQLRESLALAARVMDPFA